MRDLFWILYRSEHASQRELRDALAEGEEVIDDGDGYFLFWGAARCRFRVTSRDPAVTVAWIAKQVNDPPTKAGAKRAASFEKAGFDQCTQLAFDDFATISPVLIDVVSRALFRTRGFAYYRWNNRFLTAPI